MDYQRKIQQYVKILVTKKQLLYSRTPGSRQPSPGEEEFQKNATLTVSTNAGSVILLKPGDVMGTGEEHFLQAFAQAPHHLQHHQAPPTHHLQQSHANQLFGAQGPPQGPPLSQQQQGPPQQDNSGHFDVQVSATLDFIYFLCGGIDLQKIFDS